MSIVLSILVAAVGVALGVAGVRGRAIDDHPVCSRCGFDLLGRPAGVTVCGECGSDLTGPGSIRIGHRRRRSGFLIAGLFVGVPAIVATGVGVWSTFDSVSYLHYMPLGWVLRETASTNQMRRTEAFGELSDRTGSQRFTDGQWRAVAAAAQATRSDPSAKWNAQWGIFFHGSVAHQQMPVDLWTAYFDDLIEKASMPRSDRQAAALAELADWNPDSGQTDGQWNGTADKATEYVENFSNPWEPRWTELIADGRDRKHVD